MQFPVGILIMLLLFGFAIVIVTWPRPKAPPKPRFHVIDLWEKKD